MNFAIILLAMATVALFGYVYNLMIATPFSQSYLISCSITTYLGLVVLGSVHHILTS